MKYTIYVQNEVDGNLFASRNNSVIRSDVQARLKSPGLLWLIEVHNLRGKSFAGFVIVTV